MAHGAAPKTDAGDASVPGTGGVARTISTVAASPTLRRPLALSMGDADQDAVNSSSARNMGTCSDGNVPSGSSNMRRATRGSSSEGTEQACKTPAERANNSVVRSLRAEEVRLPSLERARVMPLRQGDGKRLLLRGGARLGKGGDGGLVTATDKPVQDHKWRGWEGESERQAREEDEAFAYDNVQLFWTIDGGPVAGGERGESAEDRELGLSAPRSSFRRQPSLSIDEAGGNSQDTRGAEGSAAAPRSIGVGPARGTAEHIAKVTAYVKQTLRDAREDEQLKRRKRVQTQQAAFASRDRENAATSLCRQLGDMMKDSWERSVYPDAMALTELRRAWINKRDSMQRAEAKARKAMENLAEARGTLVTANGNFESVRRALGAMFSNRSPSWPAPSSDSAGSAGVSLANARREEMSAKSRVHRARASAVDASSAVDAEAAGCLALSREISRAISAYENALASYRKLEGRLRVATSAEAAAKQEATNVKIDCIKPFQEHIAATNRFERTHETYEVLRGRRGRKAYMSGRSDASGGYGGDGAPRGERQAAGVKRGANATTGKGFDGKAEGDRMVVANSERSDLDMTGEGRVPKRRRHLGVFVS